MLIKKYFYIILIGALFPVAQIDAQAIFTVQTGKVVYGSYSTNPDSLLLRKYSKLCNLYIKRYYPRKKLPLVYLIPVRSDCIKYELSYDNRMGNSIDNKANKEYVLKDKYARPGIRIRFYSKEDKSNDILRLLEYGITHLRELKRLRKSFMNLEYYDQPDNLSISHEKIEAILGMPPSPKIKAVLNTWNTKGN